MTIHEENKIQGFFLNFSVDVALSLLTPWASFWQGNSSRKHCHPASSASVSDFPRIFVLIPSPISTWFQSKAVVHHPLCLKSSGTGTALRGKLVWNDPDNEGRPVGSSDYTEMQQIETLQLQNVSQNVAHVVAVANANVVRECRCKMRFLM